jgi:hypothetical protein
MVARGATFAFGVGMWGQPLLIWAGKKAMAYLPDNWEELLDIRKWVKLGRCPTYDILLMICDLDTDETSSILSRAPTDAQLTIHLLRVAEALETPLPRAP